MEGKDLAAGLKRWACDRGYRVAWGAASVVDEARSHFEKLRSDKEVGERLSREYLSGFGYLDTEEIEEPRSVVMLAMQRPAHRLIFDLDRGTIITILPPTYVQYNRTREDTIRDLGSSGVFGAHDVEVLKAPLKWIAARLGLAAYGRNNIAYVDGFGSYFQLVGAITDAALPEPSGEKASEPGLLPECENCTLCAKACPTGAIRTKCRVIDHERCFTMHSESAEPWPNWIERLLNNCFSRHCCLVGCLACQEACPVNRGKLKTVQAGISFSPEETTALLESKPGETIAEEDTIRSKLVQIGMDGYYESFRINLKSIYQAGC